MILNTNFIDKVIKVTFIFINNNRNYILSSQNLLSWGWISITPVLYKIRVRISIKLIK
jgi:hypothetical protein